MPKNPTNKRLDELFEGIQDEQARPQNKPKRKSTPRPAEKKPAVSAAHPVATRPAPHASLPQTRGLSPLENTAVTQRGGTGTPSSLSLAFQMDNRNWATLQVVDETAAREWDTDEKLLVKQVVDQLSQALESARLFQETRSRAEELSVLNEMGRELTSLFSVEAIAKTVHKYASRLMDTTNFFVALYDEARQEITPFYVVSNRERIDVPARKLGNSLTDFVLRTCKPLFIPEDLPARVKELGIEIVTFGNNRLAQCWMGAPLLVGDTVLGAVGVQNLDSPNIFTERHRDLLIAISSQAAIAIQNARLFEETRESREALAHSEGELRALFSAMNDVIIVYDKDGRYVRIAPTNPSRLFLPPQEMIGKLVSEVLPASIAEILMSAIRRALETGETISVEYPLTINQVEYWFEGAVSKLTEEQVFLVARDITERRRVAEVLRASEERFRAILDNIEDGFYEIDLAGNLTFLNPALARILGRPLNELIGVNNRAFMPPAELKNVFQTYNRVFKTKIPEQAFNWDLMRPDGTFRSVEASVSPIQAKDGSITGFRGTVRDITERKQAEEDLLKFKLGIEQSTDAVFITDASGNITYVNPGFEKVYGYSRAEAIGKNPRIIKSGLLSQENYQSFWESLLSKQTISGEIVNKAKDGRLVYIEGTNSPILDENGKILGFLAVHHDISERKQAENALRLQSTALDTAANAVVLADTNGKITWVNPAFSKETGYSFEEAIGQTPRLFKSGVHDQPFYKNLWDTILSGRVWHGEVTNRHKNGELFIVEQTITPVQNAQGEITNFASIWLNITERKRQEQALVRRNEYLSATAEIGQLVTSTLDMPTLLSRTVNLVRDRFGFYHAGIFVTEETGFRAVLQAATGEAGAEMLRQKHGLQVGSKSIVGEVTESGHAVVVNDTVESQKHKFNPLLPETRAEAAIPLRVGARIIGALDIQSTAPNAFSEDDIAVLQTLADQVAIAIDNARSYELSMQAVKEMREADKLKSQFLANMSHELRTPLNSIIGFSRVILKGIDGPVTDLQQQDLLAIHNSGQHLLGLINDILDLSRIEAGKMELTFDEVDLSELITSVMSTAAGLVKEKSITLKRDLPADLPTVRADAMRIRQVLINLFSNAAKFTDEGTITVHASVADNAKGHPEITVSVTDTGLGISQEDQKKLFQPFSQVDASPTRKSGGSGLGLSISNHLIQMHGGHIGVDSEPGKGSTFYFTLPAFRGKPETASPQNARVILAIDDDPQVISLYERYLQPQGYQVVALSDPSRAVERVRQLKPFAVTLDIMMPGYDGWHVLNDLKSNAETRNVPVIVCSIVEEQEKGFNLGAADYLVKPILEDDLLNALDRLNNDGNLREILIVDDDPNDLRLIGQMISGYRNYQPILAEGGRRGWESIQMRAPDAVILDLFMPDMDGFSLLEKMRSDDKLRDIPVIIVSGGDLTPDQQKQMQEFGKRMILKHALTKTELVAALERTLERTKK